MKCVRLKKTLKTAGQFGWLANVVMMAGIGLLLVWVKMPKKWLGIGPI
jgi:hypothetical protein